jgi:hypothetical protein
MDARFTWVAPTAAIFTSHVISGDLFSIIFAMGVTTDYRHKCVSKKGQRWYRAILTKDKGLYHLETNVLESTSYLLPLASKTSFTELYAKPLRAPTLIRLPCCAILACSKVGT